MFFLGHDSKTTPILLENSYYYIRNYFGFQKSVEVCVSSQNMEIFHSSIEGILLVVE